MFKTLSVEFNYTKKKISPHTRCEYKDNIKAGTGICNPVGAPIGPGAGN